jgi:uncharacterized damage-inducible protein DinB
VKDTGACFSGRQVLTFTLERMNKQDLVERCDYFDLVHGVTLRAIGIFGDRDLDFRPRPEMRTPRDLIFHTYTQEKLLAESARDGAFTIEMANLSNPEDPSNASALDALATVAKATAYANRCHRIADDIFRGISDDQVERPVESPFGTYPAWRYFAFAYDEHWHHRGQLYSYLRLLGKEPPMLYDYQPT